MSTPSKNLSKATAKMTKTATAVKATTDTTEKAKTTKQVIQQVTAFGMTKSTTSDANGIRTTIKYLSDNADTEYEKTAKAEYDADAQALIEAVNKGTDALTVYLRKALIGVMNGSVSSLWISQMMETLEKVAYPYAQSAKKYIRSVGMRISKTKDGVGRVTWTQECTPGRIAKELGKGGINIFAKVERESNNGLTDKILKEIDTKVEKELMELCDRRIKAIKVLKKKIQEGYNLFEEGEAESLSQALTQQSAKWGMLKSAINRSLEG